MNADALDRITTVLLDRAGGDEALGPSALTFLLRRYADTGREELRDSVENGLTRALDAVLHERDPVRRCEWLDMLPVRQVCPRCGALHVREKRRSLTDPSVSILECEKCGHVWKPPAAVVALLAAPSSGGRGGCSGASGASRCWCWRW